jgi:hypothetical protein
MSTPRFVVAVRDKEGVAKLFRIQHESVQNYEQVMALVRDEIPDVRVILASVN